MEEGERTSDARDVDPPEDGPAIYEFVRQFMREQAAYVPPPSIELAAGDMRAGREVELVARDDLPADAVERLDFVGMAGSGAKAKGICKARGPAAPAYAALTANRTVSVKST